MNIDESRIVVVNEPEPQGREGRTDEPRAEGRRAEGSRATPASERPVLMRAGALIGYSVLNSHGEDLGKIEDIMLDTRGGRIAYAVLSYGSVLGVGGKMVAVPWDAR